MGRAGRVLFASAWDDGVVSFWDGHAGTLLGSVALGRPVTPAFAPDDRSLLLAGTDGSVSSWQLDPTSWVATACRLAGRDLTPEEWSSYLGERPFVRVCPA